jgi:hypothetical protein
VTTDKHYFIEENRDGKFAVRAKGSQRASGLLNMQKQAEALVKKLNPNDKPDVESHRSDVDGRLRCVSRSLSICLPTLSLTRPLRRGGTVDLCATETG